MHNLIPKAEKKLQAIMNVDKCRIFVLDKENQELYRYDTDGMRKNYPVNSGIVGYTINKKEHEKTSNGYSSPLFNGTIDIETSMPLITWPIKHSSSNDDIIGVFQSVNVRGIRGLAHSAKSKLSTFDSESLEFFAKQLAQGIINNQIYEGLGLDLSEVGTLLEVQQAMSRAGTMRPKVDSKKPSRPLSTNSEPSKEIKSPRLATDRNT